MPSVKYKDKIIHCTQGTNLRELLHQHNVSPHNGSSRWINCMGLGTCGTCAVKIEGHVNEPTTAEKIRLAIPPHKPSNGLRLACQVQVLGDLTVTKGDGFWGQYPPCQSPKSE